MIREVHTASRCSYRIRRVHANLRIGRGSIVGHQSVLLPMRRAGIQRISGCPHCRHIPGMASAGDRSERQFHRDLGDQLRVTGITEHPTREAKVHCAVVLDA